MHVLIVSHYLPPHVGGIEVLVSELAARLRGAGHRVTLLSSAIGAKGTEDSIDTHRVPAWNILEDNLHVPFPIFAPSILPTMRQAVRSADVVHAHGVLYLSSLFRRNERRGGSLSTKRFCAATPSSVGPEFIPLTVSMH